ncbi:MAG: DUF4406 domain-containing protein [Mangrovibacterium sp.]
MAKRCYNSGKISGLPNNEYMFNFIVADYEIESKGYIAINPLHHGIKNDVPWIIHMIVDISLMLTCSTVYLQRNWKNSKGARIEHRIAKFFGLKIIYQHK